MMVMGNPLYDAQKRYDAGQNVSNDNRRLWAKLSVEFFAALTGDTDASWEENIENLLADLLHYCKRENIDLYGLLETAHDHFAEEEAEEVLKAHTPEDEKG